MQKDISKGDKNYFSCHKWFFIFLFIFAATCFAGEDDIQHSRTDRNPNRSPPYAADSPWNLRIGPDPDYDELSDELIATLNGSFGCDPSQYTYPVYDRTDTRTPIRKILVQGVYSAVTENGQSLEIRKDTVVKLPVPDFVSPSRGTDGQVIFIDRQTGDEWGFWRFRSRADGTFVAQNGYRYNVGWTGVPPLGFISRGAGVPYLAGLVRPEEIQKGRIDHALAFGCPNPSYLFVYPATKSDGDGGFPALPEGARLQLDPGFGEADFEKWGLSSTGKIVARALQNYGMILVDGSGHPKIYVEDIHTADWGGLLDADTVKPIPYSAFRVLDLEAPRQPRAPRDVKIQTSKGHVTLNWTSSPSATRYKIKRKSGEGKSLVLGEWITKSRYRDDSVRSGMTYEYSLYAVSHNGVSPAARVKVMVVQ